MLSLSRRSSLKSTIAASLFRLLTPSQNPSSSSCGGGGTRKLLPFGVLRTRTLSSSASSPPDDGGGWTEEVEYLDEAGEVICSGRGFVRPVDPGRDAHILVGDRPRPLSDAAAAAKILEIARRWRWGPEMEAHLGRLHFVPSPRQLSRALADLLQPAGIAGASTVDTALGLLRWARRQSWYAPDGGAYALLLDRLSAAGDFDGLQALFDDMMVDAGAVGGREESAVGTSTGRSSPFSAAANRAIQHLARAGRLEVSFHCFKVVCDHPGLSGALETPTYNALINLFLSRGLPYKAFEIYESMESSDCTMDAATYDLLVPALARSGRLDAALKLYEEMKSSPGLRPSFSIYSSLVDSLGKSGRLDQSLRLYREMQGAGHRPSAAMFGTMIESFIKAGKLDAGVKLWEEMKGAGFRPNFGLYTMVVEAHAKSGRLETAAALFSEMEKAGFLPTPATYASLIEIHSASGQVDAAMRLYSSMVSAGMRPGLNTYTALLSVLANKKLLDVAGKILLEMKASGFSVDVHASDMLMVYIKDGSTNLALRWLQFMGSVGIRTNNFIVRQLFESCMRTGLYESAKPLLETYVGSAAKVDLILYTSILAHLVRCKEEAKERQLMGILSTTGHKAHAFMCGLFMGPEQRGEPVLAFVREFFQGMDYELEEGAARYFVNVLLNYLVLMGQMNRARCVWKVAYENKLFPKAIVFDHNIAWSLDVRSLSVGAALVAVVHTLHRFRKRMLYYGVVPRRIKLVTGPTLKMVIAQVLASVESPFEVSKVVLRAPGDSVLEWFKKPIVQQFLLNEIPTKADILMHRLNVLFPSSAPEVRSLSPPKPISLSKAMY
ncbi:hypothetical protein Taro_046108 [Colocasia esculenta]|uniref:Smr domain-containing protein n=1 Tax=Colocasia esculenta TaxID=4460 RepID=A0A843WYI9_COLES|nr:hypothetical protein [Colocasia esculenta]